MKTLHIVSGWLLFCSGPEPSPGQPLDDRHLPLTQIGFVVIYNRGYRVNVPVSGFARMTVREPSTGVFETFFPTEEGSQYCLPIEFANETAYPDPSAYTGRTYASTSGSINWNRNGRRWPEFQAPQ